MAQGGYADSFIGNLTRSTLREKLTELESGDILQSRNIRNAIEQDFFGWYTSAWTKEAGRALWRLAETLEAYDIATFELEADRSHGIGSTRLPVQDLRGGRRIPAVSASLSKEAHAAATRGDVDAVNAAETKINAIVEKLWQ